MTTVPARAARMGLKSPAHLGLKSPVHLGLKSQATDCRPCGTPEVDVFDFGGISVSVVSESRSFLRLVAERYGAFATGEAAGWRLTYRVIGDRVPSPLDLAVGRQEPIRSRRDGRRLAIETASFRLDLDHDRSSAEINGPLATYPVDRLIQVLAYESWRRGLIVHGAALADGGRGWLASGPSGSGKSTLAALFPERSLCDEFTALRLDGGRPRLAALPFWNSRRGGAPLCGIYLLKHGRSDRRMRLPTGEAFRRLRREVLWPTFDPKALERAFDTLGELLDRVPVWELAFRPRRDVWRVIRREAGR